METILVVEDDHVAQVAMKRLFEYEGYRVEICGDGQAALDRLRTISPTAITLDLGLPGISGKDVCREIRRGNRSLPIIIVSALAEETDQILMLELGADDYITKPFSPRELLARVKAAIRRSAAATNTNEVEFGEAYVNFSKMEAMFSGRCVDLTAHEFRMLRFLVENADRVVSRQEVLTKVFGYSALSQSRSMDNLILRLRRKLEHEPNCPVYLQTVRGVGYRFAQWRGFSRFVCLINASSPCNRNLIRTRTK